MLRASLAVVGVALLAAGVGFGFPFSPLAEAGRYGFFLLFGVAAVLFFAALMFFGGGEIE